MVSPDETPPPYDPMPARDRDVGWGASKRLTGMKIIAVTNIKGGVGKTTTAVNLAYLCAVSGRRTLLWDLDSQGAATYTLGGEPPEHELASAKKLLAGKRELPELSSQPGTRDWICCPRTSPIANSMSI